jgi:hypothetical protein
MPLQRESAVATPSSIRPRTVKMPLAVSLSMGAPFL